MNIYKNKENKSDRRDIDIYNDYFSIINEIFNFSDNNYNKDIAFKVSEQNIKENSFCKIELFITEQDNLISKFEIIKLPKKDFDLFTCILFNIILIFIKRYYIPENTLIKFENSNLNIYNLSGEYQNNTKFLFLSDNIINEIINNYCYLNYNINISQIKTHLSENKKIINIIELYTESLKYWLNKLNRCEFLIKKLNHK